MGFADPLALLFSGLLGVLVLLYLWERRRPQVDVPSLLLWRALREDTLRAQRFRPDLLFFLQALALACLIFGLARPYLPLTGSSLSVARQIVVLDTTASMQARENGVSRWETALALVRRDIDALPDGTEIMLIAAADAPQVALPFTRDRAAVHEAIARLEPVDTGGDLTVALAHANSARARSDLPVRVNVYTDRPAAELPAAVRAQVRIEQVGASDDNLAIEALQVFQGRFQDPRQSRVEVRVRSFSGASRHGLLTVQLDDAVLLRTGFTLPGRALQTFTVNRVPGPGLLTARVAAGDALAVDDVAYGWVRPAEPLRLAIVSPDARWAAALAEAARRMPGLQLRLVAAGDPWPDEPIDVAILHHYAPRPAPPVNSLYIYPPADSGLFVAAGEAAQADILDWNARHPVLQQLRPVNAQPLRRVRIVTPPAGSQGLLWSRAGERELPLAFANEQDGRRSICLTFDLDAARLLDSDNLSLFLFLLNSLSWLAPGSEQTVTMRSGSTWAIARASGAEVTVITPGGDHTPLGSPGERHRPEQASPAVRAGDGSVALAFTPRHTGEYRLRIGDAERRVLVDFQDTAESDIGRQAAPASVPPAITELSAAAAVPSSDFGRWLYLGAALLLLAEWWAASRRGT